MLNNGNILIEAMNFARQYVNISNDDYELFSQAKKSLLFHRGKIWQKKGSENFDNTMGAQRRKMTYYV